MSNEMQAASLNVACPHCGVANRSGDSFCAKCGKALPATRSLPRVVEGADLATSAGGRQLQSAELHRKARSASGALLAVAILATIGLGLVYYFVRDAMNDPALGRVATIMLISQAVIAVAYWGLWIWSWSNPLPAAIIGLVIFLTMIAVNALAAGPQSLVQGLLIKVIVIFVLARAIQAGVQHRSLQQQMS